MCVSHSVVYLWNLMNCSPPGTSVHGILQASVLEWVAISFSNAWKWKVKVKSLSRVRPFPTAWTAAHQAPLSLGFSRQEYWSGCHRLLRMSPILSVYSDYCSVAESCPTVWDARDCSTPGFPVLHYQIIYIIRLSRYFAQYALLNSDSKLASFLALLSPGHSLNTRQSICC